MKCEITPLNDNIVVEDIVESRKAGGIITSSSNEKTSLKSYKVVALPPDNPFPFLILGDEVLCGEDDLKLYTYSRKRLYLIKGDYISGVKEKTIDN